MVSDVAPRASGSQPLSAFSTLEIGERLVSSGRADVQGAGVWNLVACDFDHNENAYPPICSAQPNGEWLQWLHLGGIRRPFWWSRPYWPAPRLRFRSALPIRRRCRAPSSEPTGSAGARSALWRPAIGSVTSRRRAIIGRCRLSACKRHNAVRTVVVEARRRFHRT